MEIGRRLLAFDFVGVAINKERQDVAARNDSVDVDHLPVQVALPSTGLFLQFQAVRRACDDDFINHRVRIRESDQRSPSDRPCFFQFEETVAGPPELAPPDLPFLIAGEAGSSTANIPVAITAIASSALISGFGASAATAGLVFASRRSRYPVSSLPAWKSASPRMRRNSEILVLMPATKYS